MKSADEEGEVCAICCDELVTGEVNVLDCGHQFHLAVSTTALYIYIYIYVYIYIYIYGIKCVLGGVGGGCIFNF